MSSEISAGLSLPADFHFWDPRTRSKVCLLHSSAAGGRAASAFTFRQSNHVNSPSNRALIRAIRPSLITGQVKLVCSRRLLGHHQTCAIPVELFQPICPLCAEHKYRLSERLFAQLIFSQRCQPVMTFVEVHWFSRHNDPHSVRQEHHARTDSAYAT